MKSNKHDPSSFQLSVAIWETKDVVPARFQATEDQTAAGSLTYQSQISKTTGNCHTTSHFEQKSGTHQKHQKDC